MQIKNNFGELTFGFDIGIASVGWAVLNETRIIDLGVRCFDKAETPKDGESLNLARRTARLMRRRLRRRAWRLTKLARLLKREGLISDVNILKQPPAKGFATPQIWQLRVDALNRELSAEEWARVIYHLCKHRGFHWTSKAEKLKEEDGASESGKVKKGLAATAKLMKDKSYKTAAQMVLAEFPQAQRNKQGEYNKALARELLSEELETLFATQRSFNNPHTSKALEEKLLDRKTGLLWAQKPSLSGEALLIMLGKCTFEKSEYRAPKASFTAERHVWLTRLNNLRIVVDGITRPLNETERQFALALPYKQAADLSYKQFKTAFTKAGFWSESVRFTGLSYPSLAQIESGKAKDPEGTTLIKIPAFHDLRTTLKKAGLETEWQGLVNAAMAGGASLIDEIAWILSIYKEDDEVERELNKLALPNQQRMLDALSGIRFDKFSNLSLKALRKIVPHMERGLRYDEACVEAGYHHSQLVKADDEKLHYLPPFYSARDPSGKLIFNENLDIPRNPVVLRALNQARKVCNALIKKYGSPYQVNIEMARDLSRPLDERRKIQTEQEAYRDRNQVLRNTFNETFNATGELKGRDFEKWQLYTEQQCKCAYSLEPLDIHRLFEQGYVEIDHALPYSRSFDDSKNNRVLALAAENRNKGNQTPYEYLDGKSNSARWHQFEVYVNSNKAYRQAKRSRLLRKDFGAKESAEFKERNLNDTRYICRFFKNYVEQFLQLADNSEVKRCVVLSGQMTSFLRNRWGLVKVRADSDRHHALDAAVVAAASHGMVKRLSDYARRKELDKVSEGFVDVTTGEIVNPVMYQQLKEHFPDPWPHFRQELEARRTNDDIDSLRAELANLGTYSEPDLAAVKPLFVSRAPQRLNSGALHKETIYGGASSGQLLQPLRTKRKEVSNLKESDLDSIVGAIEPRNEGLRKSLRKWLKSQDELKQLMAGLGKGKAKREATLLEKEQIDKLSQPPRKPLKSDPDNGPYTGPEIKKVKLLETSKSGVLVRGGIAELGKVISTKIYRFQDELLFQPRYEASYEKLFGMTTIPPEAIYTGIELYANEVVRIEHPNLIYCYRSVRKYIEQETGETLVDVVSVFPDGRFLGYWLYFEPSNNRPVVGLHDSREFFLLEANKSPLQKQFTLIEKEKKEGNKTTYEYFEKSPPLERRALKFSLEKDIKRQISSAQVFIKLNVDVLGNLYADI